MDSADEGASGSRRVRVILIDDDLFVRATMTKILRRSAELVMVGTYSSGQDAVRSLHLDKPHVALIDIAMPDWDGPRTVGAIRAADPRVQIVALTSMTDKASAARMLHAGAIGFLVKDLPVPHMLAAIRTAAGGVAVLTDPALALLATEDATDPPPLTEWETTILRLVMEGRSNAEIGETVHLSQFTVKRRVAALSRKLGTKNRISLAVRGAELGLQLGTSVRQSHHDLIHPDQ